MTDKIEKIKINTFIPFENHPFKVRTGEEHGTLLRPLRKSVPSTK